MRDARNSASPIGNSVFSFSSVSPDGTPVGTSSRLTGTGAMIQQQLNKDRRMQNLFKREFRKADRKSRHSKNIQPGAVEHALNMAGLAQERGMDYAGISSADQMRNQSAYKLAQNVAINQATQATTQTPDPSTVSSVPTASTPAAPVINDAGVTGSTGTTGEASPRIVSDAGKELIRMAQGAAPGEGSRSRGGPIPSETNDNVLNDPRSSTFSDRMEPDPFTAESPAAPPPASQDRAAQLLASAQEKIATNGLAPGQFGPPTPFNRDEFIRSQEMKQGIDPESMKRLDEVNVATDRLSELVDRADAARTAEGVPASLEFLTPGGRESRRIFRSDDYKDARKGLYEAMNAKREAEGKSPLKFEDVENSRLEEMFLSLFEKADTPTNEKEKVTGQGKRLKEGIRKNAAVGATLPAAVLSRLEKLAMLFEKPKKKNSPIKRSDLAFRFP